MQTTHSAPTYLKTNIMPTKHTLDELLLSFEYIARARLRCVAQIRTKCINHVESDVVWSNFRR